MNDARRWLAAQERTVRGPLLVTVALGSVIGALVIGQTALVVRVVDAVVFASPGPAIEPSVAAALARAIALLPAIIVTRALVTLASRRAAAACSSRVKRSVRSRLLAAIARSGPVELGTERPGELATTVVDGVEELDAYFSHYLPQRVLAALLPLLILVVAYPVDLTSGLILTATALFIPVLMVVVGSEAAERNRRWWRELSDLSARLFDALAGLTTLKAFGAARDEVNAIRAVSERHRHATMDVLRVAFVSSLMLELVTTVSIAIVAVTSGFRLLHGTMEFARAYFILLIAPEFYLPLRNLGTHYHSRMAALAVAERMDALLREEPTGASHDARTGDPRRQGNAREGIEAAPAVRALVLELRDVSVRYRPVVAYETAASGAAAEGASNGAQRPALEGIDLHIGAGERVAIVGPSGGGKSTLLALALRFVEPERGSIFVDGSRLGDLDRERWRARIGWVPQRPTMFHGTLRWNIALGRDGVTDDEIVRAVEQAGLAPVVARLPDGLDSLVGERGRTLSGGEAQRVGLARLFLRSPDVLLLDEPTAYLDPQTERLVVERLDAFSRGRTTLIVAHGPRAATIAERAIVINQGRIVQSGTHEELVRSVGLYRELFAQAGGGS